jgi:hypothetical protein
MVDMPGYVSSAYEEFVGNAGHYHMQAGPCTGTATVHIGHSYRQACCCCCCYCCIPCSVLLSTSWVCDLGSMLFQTAGSVALRAPARTVSST